MARLIFIILCTSVLRSFGQVTYTGFVGTYPIELVADIYTDGAVQAIYVYSNFDTPIIVNGTFKGDVLELNELNPDGKKTATLTFDPFNPASKTVIGVWKNLESNKELAISLKKKFTIELGQAGQMADKALLQSVSMKDNYFRVVVSQSSGYPRVSKVEVYRKKTDEHLQSFEIDCQQTGMSNVAVDDYNFDGFQEFSVFESSYAGSNTSSIYFLYNPRTKHFYKSELGGVSLSFDQATKTITESNSCCAGSIRTTAIYKVVDNKMVLIEEHCFRWDEAKEELVEKPMAECK